MKVKMISKPNQKLVYVDPEFDTEGIDEEDWECIYCEDFFSTGDTDDYTAMSIFDYDYDSGIVKFEFEGSDHELLELGDDPDGSTEVWDVYKRIELFTEEFNIEWAICLFIDDSGEMVTSIDSEMYRLKPENDDDAQAEDEHGQTEEIKNGPYESFHENGQLEVKGTYKDGKMDGLCEHFYESGQLNWRENYKDGELDGPWEWFYENGELMTRATFINGKKEGLLESFHGNGQLQMTENYKDNELDGLVEEFDENGELSIRENYKDGVLQDEDDEQTEEIKNGLYESFHENGELSKRENYKDGELEGLKELFHENGQLKSRSNYKDGKEESLYESFYENGQLEERTNFKNGKLDGLSEEFHEDGELFIREDYKDGEQIAIYKANGKHVSCDYSEMFFETLGDDFQRDDSIVIVEVIGENFENFIDPETETEAYKIFKNLSFKEIGYVDYGDWDELSSIVGKEEVEQLRKIYFDCDDYAETIWTVLLYHNFTYVTLVRGDTDDSSKDK